MLGRARGDHHHGAACGGERGLAVRSRLMLLLGDASYALYLLHPIVVGQLIQLAPRLAPLSWLLCLLAATATVARSVTFHLRVEARLLRRLGALAGGNRPATSHHQHVER